MRDETFLIDYSKSKTDDLNSPETDFILEQKKKNFSGTVRSAKMILTHCAPSSRVQGQAGTDQLCCGLFSPGFQRALVLEWKTCTVGTVPWGMGLVNEN